MKKLIVPAFILLLAGCKEPGQNTFTVDGTIKNTNAQTVYLEETPLNSGAPVLVDSAKLEKDGKYELSTLSKGESVYNLRLNNQEYPVATFINDADKITLNIDPISKEVYTVKGSEASEALRSYFFTSGAKMGALYNESRAIDSLQKTGASDSLINLRMAKRSIQVTELKNYMTDFLEQSKSPSLTVFTLGSYQSMASNPALGVEPFSNEEVKSIIGKAAKAHPKNEALAQINRNLQQPAAASQQQASPAASLVNKPAPDFTLPGLDGKPVSLSQFKGKWVLVDFWASWCQPCRMENPNVVKAFNQFKNKNFTILGVSLDRPGQKDKWEEAIRADGLNWNHASDLKYWDSAVVPLYNIEGIPYNVLVNPQGIVVAEGLRGEDLVKKLSEVL